MIFIIPLFSFGQQNLYNNLFRIDSYGRITQGNNSIAIKTTATTVLPKTNGLFVQASGNITDSLPTVTTADSGLMITIKNVGTFSDLVTVVAKGGKTIDGTANSMLTRWRGRTFVVDATGNWVIKDKETRADNLLDVSAKGSWATIPEVIAYLNLHMTAPTVVRLGGGTYTLAATQVINLPYPVTFEGLAYGETTIAAATGLANKPMFRCLSSVFFKMLVFDATTLANYGTLAGEDAIRLLGSGTYNEIKDFSMRGFNIGMLDSTNAEIWMQEGDINNCREAGIKLHSAVDSTRFRIVTTDFIGCDKGIWLSKGNLSYVDINGGCSFRNKVAGDSSIVYVPATFTGAYGAWISGTKWNNVGGGTAGSWVNTEQLFVIGNGTGTGASANNAFEVRKDGKVSIGSSAAARVTIDQFSAVRLYDTTIVWDDMRRAPEQLKSVGQADKPDYNTATMTMDFPEDTTEQAGFVFQLPHRFAEGYDSIYPHIHYDQDNNALPIFRLQYKWYNMGAAEPAAWTNIDSKVNVYSYTANAHQVLTFKGIPCTGKTISSVLKIRLYRRADAYVGDCKVTEFDVHIPVDAMGSNKTMSKN